MALVCHFIGLMLGGCHLLPAENPIGICQNRLYFVKDDSKGKSSSTDMESFSDLGLFTTNTNVYNEMGTLQSPDIMREVVSRLHLEMNYQTDGRFP